MLVFVLEGSKNVMSIRLQFGRDWRRRRIYTRSFCVPLLQNVPLFYQMFFCSVKNTTSLYVVYNIFVLEIKLEAITQAVIPNTSKMCAMPIPLVP